MGPSPLPRRRFLTLASSLAAGSAAAAFLASCGLRSSTDPSPSLTATASPLPPVGGDLNLFVWRGYETPGGTAAWLRQQGITEHVRYLTQPDEVPTVLQGPDGARWDMSYGDNVSLSYYRDLGLIRPITTDEVPGLTGLMPAFQTVPWKNDDGTYNGVPWTWGFTGLTYRTDAVPAPGSWQDILAPKFRGRVSTVDGALNNVEIACIAVGVDPDAMTLAQLHGPVRAWLMRLRRQIHTIAPSIADQVMQLTSGAVDYMVCGFTFLDRETAKAGVQTKTVVPSEGAIGWADTTFIPPTAPNPQNALAFANRLLDPRTNADANGELLQGPTVTAAVPLLSPQAKALYPSDTIDTFLEHRLTFNTGFPHEPDGDLATFDDVVQTWNEVKRA